MSHTQASPKCRRKRPCAAQTERETSDVSFLVQNVWTNQRQPRYLFNNVPLIRLDTFRRVSCPALTPRRRKALTGSKSRCCRVHHDSLGADIMCVLRRRGCHAACQRNSSVIQPFSSYKTSFDPVAAPASFYFRYRNLTSV